MGLVDNLLVLGFLLGQQILSSSSSSSGGGSGSGSGSGSLYVFSFL